MNKNMSFLFNNLTEMLILLFLKKKDSYVYEITRAISDCSEGNLTISQNTIYTATYKLEHAGMISEYTELVGKKRTRVYYHIEEKGLDYLDDLMKSYRATVISVQMITGKLQREEYKLLHR